jgi:hypothetical protein
MAQPQGNDCSQWDNAGKILDRFSAGNRNKKSQEENHLLSRSLDHGEMGEDILNKLFVMYHNVA